MRASVLDAIGTPLVRVKSPRGATVAAKLESQNPGGSAKDRPALSMVEAAERAGALAAGDRIVEPTSGNTGIGLAMVAAARGYDLTLVMPERMSEERRRLLRAYGADLELVDGDMTDARERADELTAGTDAIQLGQFENPANPDAHRRTTAEEILADVGGRDVDAFVAAVGTGGTLSGTAGRLLEVFPEMTVVAVEPERNAVISGEPAGEDGFQGMGPGFVPANLDADLVDEVETVALADAEAECRRLAREEGILVGQSSGAASVAATRVAERLADPAMDCPPAPAIDGWNGAGDGAGPLSSDGGEHPAGPAGPADPAGAGPLTPDGRGDVGDGGYDDCPLVVTVFPDSGERYLSAGVFDAE